MNTVEKDFRIFRAGFLSCWVAGALSVLVALAASSCSAANTAVVQNGITAACEVVFQVVGQPQLAPLCTDSLTFAQAIESLFGDAGTAVVAAPGGIVGRTSAARSSLTAAQQVQVYQYLLAHGAAALGG